MTLTAVAHRSMSDQLSSDEDILMKDSIQVCVLTASISLALALPALAADEYNVSSGVTTEGAPLGVHGVDPVQLAKRHALVQGSSNFATVYDGVTYYFGSAVTRDAFVADPTAYMPEFGGFCAFAVGLGKKFDGDPKFADIVDGKLYLFVNGDVYDAYKADADAILTASHQKWPEIQHIAVGDL